MKFKGRVIQGWKGEIIGEALITRSKISFLGDIDNNTGEIVGSDIDIKGENVKDKVLIFPEGRGSTVGSNVLYGLSRRNLAPKLIATSRAELISISGAIYGEIPMISNLSEDVFNHIRKGDVVRVTILNGEACLEKLEAEN